MDAYCSRQNYFEILVGNKEERPVNELYVAHGNECEKYGIAQVMLTTGEIVRSCGTELLGEQINTEVFYIGNENTKIVLSCTPDGYVGEDSLVEIKAPYFAQDDMDKYITGYLPQIYFQQYLTKRDHTYVCIYQMDNSRVFRVPYNKDYVDNFMLPKVFEFASYLLKGELDKKFKTKRNSKKDFIYNGKYPYTDITDVKKVANV